MVRAPRLLPRHTLAIPGCLQWTLYHRPPGLSVLVPLSRKRVNLMDQRTDKALLVTNHHLFRECLVNGLVSRIPGLHVDTAESSQEGLQYCQSESYSLAIFDADPPDPFSPGMTRNLRCDHPAIQVIAVGRSRKEEDVIAYLEAGAIDFRITDTESLDVFCEAVVKKHSGEISNCPERTRALFARLQKLSTEVSRMKTIDAMVLTNREMEILRLLDEGRSNLQIAKTLHISLHTVKNHVHRILDKLQVSNRREAVHLAYNSGWLKVEVN
jgi:two-component system nitrate/nitrite response regulator NarL